MATGSLSSRAEAAGRELARYGLVAVVGWIGLMKFTAYEAEGIQPFVANSPLMSWVYGLMSVQDFTALLGVVEVGMALLIAARPFAHRACALGSLLAVGMFLTTLSAKAVSLVHPTQGLGVVTGPVRVDMAGMADGQRVGGDTPRQVQGQRRKFRATGCRWSRKWPMRGRSGARLRRSTASP
jgi:hypothetical protein